MITLTQITQTASKLRSHGANLIRRTRIRYAGHGIPEAEVRRHLEALYASPDPWRMDSEQERFRFARTNDILLRELIAPALRVGSILEIGCGEGHQSVYLKELCNQLTGIDLVPSAIERASVRVPHAEWAIGNLREQTWASDGRKFDIVTACEVLPAFADIPRTLQLMSRLGRACIVTCFQGDVLALERPLRKVPLQGRESFAFGKVTWHAAWWRNNGNA